MCAERNKIEHFLVSLILASDKKYGKMHSQRNFFYKMQKVHKFNMKNYINKKKL